MKVLRVLTISAVFCSQPGCNEDNPAAVIDNGTLNQQATSTTASSAFSATQLALGGDGQSAALSLLAVGLGAFTIVTPDNGKEATAIPRGGERHDGHGVCECGANSCTFHGCDVGGFAIEGTISWSDTTLDCDYSISRALKMSHHR